MTVNMEDWLPVCVQNVSELMYNPLRASCLTLEINGCYEAKIEESEKASSHQEMNPGHLWFEPPVLCH